MVEALSVGWRDHARGDHERAARRRIDLDLPSAVRAKRIRRPSGELLASDHERLVRHRRTGGRIAQPQPQAAQSESRDRLALAARIQPHDLAAWSDDPTLVRRPPLGDESRFRGVDSLECEVPAAIGCDRGTGPLAPLAGVPGAYRVVLAPDANVLRAAEEYGHDPLVTRAEPNYFLRIDRPAEAPDAVRMDVEPRTR